MHRDNTVTNFAGLTPAFAQPPAANPNGNAAGEANQAWNTGPPIQLHPAMAGQGNGRRDITPALGDYQALYRNQVAAGRVQAQAYTGYGPRVNEHMNRKQSVLKTIR